MLWDFFKNRMRRSTQSASDIVVGSSDITLPLPKTVASNSDGVITNMRRVEGDPENNSKRKTHSMDFSILMDEDSKQLSIIQELSNESQDQIVSSGDLRFDTHSLNLKRNKPEFEIVSIEDLACDRNLFVPCPQTSNYPSELDRLDIALENEFIQLEPHMTTFSHSTERYGEQLPPEGLDYDLRMPQFRSITPMLSHLITNNLVNGGIDPNGYDFDSLHRFCDENFRLRRRDTSKSDAQEAGFEDDAKNHRHSRISTVSRTQSTHAIGGYSNSQFTAQDLLNGNSKNSVEYAQPMRSTAVVGPRKASGGISLSQSTYEFNEREIHGNRRSVQTIQSTPYYNQGYSVDPSGGDRDSMPTHLIPPTNRDPYSTPIQNGSGRNTPQMSRRSVNMMSNPLAHSTPNSHTKISAVAPQPHRSHRGSDSQRHNSSYSESRRGSAHNIHNGAVVLPTYHHTYKGNGDSGRHYSQEIIVDEPPSPKDPRVASLEQRVRELESAVIQGSPVVSSRHPQTHVVIANSPHNQMTQQLMAKDIVDKELEIERLQTQLRKTYSKMEIQQIQYNDEVRLFKQDSETAKDELLQVKNRLNALEKECNLYKDKAASMDSTNSEALIMAHKQIHAQEKEIARLRRDLESTSNLKEELERVREDLAYLEVQNEALNSTLDAKEDTIKDLETSMTTMKLEQSLYQQSCSSGSTPLADDCQSLVDGHRPFGSAELRKPYTKAHSTVGASLSPSPAPKNIQNSQNGGGGLAKSLSNYHLHEKTAKGEVTPAISQLMRQQQKRVLDCRLLVRCLKESAEKAAIGETPDISRLLGLKTDSMSESEAEHLAADSSAMSMNSAEKHMRRQEDYLSKLERDLDSVRASIQTIYQRQLRNEMASGDQEEACRIQ